MPRLPTLRCFFAAVCLAALLLATRSGAGVAQPHSTAKLDAAYTASLLGIPIGRIGWTVDLQDDRFSAAANGSTAGLLRIFARGHGVAEAHGTIAGKRPMSSNFMVSFTSGNAADEIKIVFKGGKAREFLEHPRPPDPALVPLTDAYRIGVVDPMTALLARVPGGGDTSVPAACERKIAVFDGHMRYDLRLEFKRLEQVQAGTGYQGPAVVCGVYFTPLAGYDPNREAIKYLRAERGMEIWLAPLTGTRLLAPFRVSVPTPIGLGVLQATRFVFTRGPNRPGPSGTN